MALWVALLTRIGICHWINIKTSRSIADCNMELMVVINDRDSHVQRQFLEAWAERDARSRAERRQRFYEEFADA